MILPLAVNIPQDRRPVMNWLVLLVTVGMFVLQRYEAHQAWQYRYRSVSADTQQEVTGDAMPGQTPRELETRSVRKGMTDALILEDWRLEQLLGYMFLHRRLWHLLFNMLFLWVFGNAICATLGNIKYLFIYLFLGICAGMPHLLFMEGTAQGASGAICGLVGMCLFLFPLQEVSCVFLLPPFPFFKRFEIGCLYLILLWVLYDPLCMMFPPEGSTTAYWVHLAGYGAGFCLAWLFAWRKWVYLDKYDTTILQVWQRRKQRLLAQAEYDRIVQGCDDVPEQSDAASEGDAK